MKSALILSCGIVGLGLLLGASVEAAAGGKVRYDERGRPFIVAKQRGKRVRVYCRRAFYGAVQCPAQRKRLRFGPYDRDFAFSQGHQIKR